MIDVVLWLSLIAACVVVGMTYSRFTPGSCCGCAEHCGGLLDEYTITVTGMPPGDSFLEGTWVLTGTENPTNFRWQSAPITLQAGNCILGGATGGTVAYDILVGKSSPPASCCSLLLRIPNNNFGYQWSRNCPFPMGVTWLNFSAHALGYVTGPSLQTCDDAYSPTCTITATGSPF